jgi:hypothetical protein
VCWTDAYLYHTSRARLGARRFMRGSEPFKDRRRTAEVIRREVRVDLRRADSGAAPHSLPDDRAAVYAAAHAFPGERSIR